GHTQEKELGELCQRVASVSPEIPLVVQPVTPFGPVRESPAAKSLIRWARLCRAQLSDVRVIPQTHRLYGAL
ncbi:MAG: radical SAM protein, partial [Myxococcota bacterium]